MNSKRKKVALLAFLLTGAFAAGAAASNGIERVDAFLRSDFKLIVDGKTAKLDNPILVYNDTSYLPIREISGLLGADVNWNNSSYTAYINSRFEGQPAQPEGPADFAEIELNNPNPIYMKYLGRDYGLLTFYGDSSVYYRVTDLNRMGVNTSGAMKYREKNTHDLFIKEEDVQKLWKETPEHHWGGTTVMSGVYESKMQTFLQSMIDDASAVPYQNDDSYKLLLPFTSVFFIDALDDHPEHYAMYYWDTYGGIGVIVVRVQKDQNNNYFRRSFTQIDLKYLHDFLSKMNGG